MRPWSLCIPLACALVLALVACDRSNNKGVPPPKPSTVSSAAASGR
jgi:hypothetical protein